jgi:hypothetical protein
MCPWAQIPNPPSPSRFLNFATTVANPESVLPADLTERHLPRYLLDWRRVHEERPMSTSPQTEAERVRRREYVRDAKGANRQCISIEKRIKQREDAAAEWAQWWRQKMESSGCDDPVQLLPDAFAKIEQAMDDRVAAAIAELRANLKRAFS